MLELGVALLVAPGGWVVGVCPTMGHGKRRSSGSGRSSKRYRRSPSRTSRTSSEGRGWTSSSSSSSAESDPESSSLGRRRGRLSGYQPSSSRRPSVSPPRDRSTRPRVPEGPDREGSEQEQPRWADIASLPDTVPSSQDPLYTPSSSADDEMRTASGTDPV